MGKLGERLAVEALARHGFAISATRHRTRFGEIDIVAKRGGEVAFVEVKARRTDRAGVAAEAITPRKRRRIAAMALDYLAYTEQLESPCQFVVVAIDGAGTPGQTVRVIEHAWTVDY